MSVQSGALLLLRRRSAHVTTLPRDNGHGSARLWPLRQVPSVHMCIGLESQLRFTTVGAGDGGDGAMTAGGVAVGSGVGVGSPTRQLEFSSGPPVNDRHAHAIRNVSAVESREGHGPLSGAE